MENEVEKTTLSQAKSGHGKFLVKYAMRKFLCTFQFEFLTILRFEQREEIKKKKGKKKMNGRHDAENARQRSVKQ